MKRISFFLSISLALSACGPLPPAPTPTLTLTPTATPTATITPSPTATLTPTITPTPSPPEIAAADFARYNLPTEGLQFETGADGVTRAIDPSAKEGKQVVYEDGEFLLRFLARYLKDAVDLMPTPYEPKKPSFLGDLLPDSVVDNYAIVSLVKKRNAAFIEQIGYDPYIKGKSGATVIMLDQEKLAWGLVYIQDRKNPESLQWLCVELADGGYLIIPLISNITREDYFEIYKSDWEY